MLHRHHGTSVRWRIYDLYDTHSCPWKFWKIGMHQNNFRFKHFFNHAKSIAIKIQKISTSLALQSCVTCVEEYTYTTWKFIVTKITSGKHCYVILVVCQCTALFIFVTHNTKFTIHNLSDRTYLISSMCNNESGIILFVVSFDCPPLVFAKTQTKRS